MNENTNFTLKEFNDKFVTKQSIFLRKCVIWQFVRFLALNVKMLKIISKSH
jgi:hypothetical protein